MNRLEHAASAYLKSAAHQPIDWYEFGEEAFEKARELDRPVLLDIGAVWCHWCHVIDRESYDDPEIARLINERFIAVKVDRDQRPDVDARYQQVVQSMSGQGGWPLTGFLTHDGRLIYGGTYFPPQVMKSLLFKISELYREKKDEILAQDDLLTEEKIQLQQAEKDRMEKAELSLEENLAPLNRNLIETLLNSAKRMFDPQYGGFGAQPKFPHFSALKVLIAEAHRQQSTLASGMEKRAGVQDTAGAVQKADPQLMAMITQTLTQMGKGGIHDQVAGGFHRYSVDRYWHVPHFEKMAYDNAEALSVYAQAYCLTNDLFYREIAEGILDWVTRDLSDQQNGGFYASQDADIDLNDDGDHFTWTIDEVKRVLTPEEADAVILFYDITDHGDMHERPGRNVLRINPRFDISWSELARSLGCSIEEAQQLIRSARAKMLSARLNERPIPFIDQTIYANWNGMMLTGYFEAADLLDREDVRRFAVKTLERLLSELYAPGEGFRHSDGVEGFLDDQAWMTMALLKAYQSTGEARYLEIAQALADWVLADFEDRELGGFFDARQSDGRALGLLKFRRKPAEDSPSSSANAVMIQSLIRLHYLTDNLRYLEAAERALRYFRPMENYGIFVGALATAVDWFTEPPLKIELYGVSLEVLRPLTDEARRLFAPGKLLSYQINPAQPMPEARVCIGQRCLTPVTDPAALSNTLRPLQTIHPRA